MTKATDALLADHKMIRKILQGFHPDSPRFQSIAKTLHRTVAGHAWFEDQIFLPAFKNEPLLQKRFVDEISDEHKDIDYFLNLVRKTNPQSKEFEFYSVQFRSILETHFKKEEDALFPLAEKILDS